MESSILKSSTGLNDLSAFVSTYPLRIAFIRVVCNILYLLLITRFFISIFSFLVAFRYLDCPKLTHVLPSLIIHTVKNLTLYAIVIGSFTSKCRLQVGALKRGETAIEDWGSGIQDSLASRRGSRIGQNQGFRLREIRWAIVGFP